MTITPKGDRVYECEPADIPRIKRSLEGAGCTHQAPTPGAFYLHRWIHFGKDGKSVITLFRTHRITVLGPAVPALDALVADEAVTV